MPKTLKYGLMCCLMLILTGTMLALPAGAQDSATERPVDSEQCMGVTNAPDEVVTALDALLREYVGSDDPYLSAPGAVIRVETADWIYYEAAGLANVESKMLLDCTQPFEIGSNTKMMTAVLLMQLVEQGKISLDDKLADYLPEFAAALPYGDVITIRQLANHTSGIFSYTDNAPDGTPGIMEGDVTNQEMLVKGYTPQELVQFAIDHGEPRFEPGAEGKWEYSNTNYILLGLIIEKVTGQTIDTLYQERIFTPLLMNDTFLWNDVPLGDFDLPQGYLGYPFDQNTTAWNLSQGWAAGAVISTASDMHKFIRALLNGELFENAGTLALMQETVPATGGLGEYGIGLIRKPVGVETWGHGGQTLGFETDVAYVPEFDMTIVVFTNASSDFAAVGARIVEQALTAAGVLPSAP